MMGYLCRRQYIDDGGVPLGVRLTRGTVTVIGGFSPAEESARPGVLAESHDRSRGVLNGGMEPSLLN